MAKTGRKFGYIDIIRIESMDIRERAKENLRSAFIYYQYRPHGKFDIINMADYNTRSSEISHSEWLTLYDEVIKESKESNMKHLTITPIKEIWQMPVEEYMNQQAQKVSGPSVGKTKKMAKTYHAIQVRQAVKDGQPVPPEVLEDYPDLARPMKHLSNIPPELQPLAEEAKKYKSAEEFVQAKFKEVTRKEAMLEAGRITLNAEPTEIKGKTVWAGNAGRTIDQMVEQLESIANIGNIEARAKYDESIREQLPQIMQLKERAEKALHNLKIKSDFANYKEFYRNKLTSLYNQVTDKSGIVIFKHLD